MSARVRSLAAFAVLVLPGVVAFASGGYFDRARLLAAGAAWILVVVAAVVAERPLPRHAAGRVALGGLAALTAWCALSLTWTETTSVALDDLQRDVLYLGALVAAAALLGRRRLARAAEPVLALAAFAAIGYGLSERALPALIDLASSFSAGGRLEQPLTYWNGEGALAALGVVLAVRLAGDSSRPRWLRCAGAGATAILGLGVYLSFSRGALVAAGAGLVALAWLAPARTQLRSIGLAVVTGAVCAVAVSPLGAVRAGDPGQDQGAVLLAIVVLATAAAAFGQRALLRAEAGGRLRRGSVRLPRARAAIAVPAILAVAVGVLALVATLERSPQTPAFGATAARLGSVHSNRYAYWRVAAGMWADAPLRGRGSGSFRQVWLERRTIADPARDAHSLYLETPAELGLVGVLALLALLGGVAVAGRRAVRADPALAAGPAAVALAWVAHAGLDWDWELPGLTLVAVVCAGLLVAAGDRAVDG
ncbi:MAG TPA: O-antigen ligase family protein [Solirubrobacteraceae bacterium]